MKKKQYLEYDILHRNKIHGQGNIENIKNNILNKSWKLYSDNDQQFILQLKLKNPSILNVISLKLLGVHEYLIKLRNKDKKIIWEKNQVILCNDNTNQLKPSDENINEITIFVDLIIRNNPMNMKKMGIFYFLFQGFHDQVLKSNFPKVNGNRKLKKHEQQNSDNNIPLQVYFQPSKKIKIQANVSKDFFNSRSKQKTSKQNLADFTQFNQFLIQNDTKKRNKSTKDDRVKQDQIRKKIKQNFQKQPISNKKSKLKYQEQTDLAIALSKSEYQANQFNMHLDDIGQYQHQINQIPQNQLPAQLKEYSKIYQPQQKRPYDVLEFDQNYLQLFQELNPKWLQAQRRAEQQAGVMENQRLSSKVQLKYLYETEIYFEGYPDWKMDELKLTAKSLGCKILSELKKNCIVMAPKQVGEKLHQKHKNQDGVKFLKHQYLEDCIGQKKRLSPSEYYVKFS